MKRIIIVIILIAAWSIGTSQTPPPENIILPFYEDPIQIPFGYTQAQTIELIGENPKMVNEDQLIFDIPILYNGYKFPSYLTVQFRDDYLINAVISFYPLDTEEKYISLLLHMFSLASEKLGEFNNLFYTVYDYPEDFPAPENSFDAIINYDAYFSYLWDRDGLTYRMSASPYKRGEVAQITIYTRSFVSRTEEGYKSEERIQKWNWQ